MAGQLFDDLRVSTHLISASVVPDRHHGLLPRHDINLRFIRIPVADIQARMAFPNASKLLHHRMKEHRANLPALVLLPFLLELDRRTKRHQCNTLDEFRVATVQSFAVQLINYLHVLARMCLSTSIACALISVRHPLTQALVFHWDLAPHLAAWLLARVLSVCKLPAVIARIAIGPVAEDGKATFAFSAVGGPRDAVATTLLRVAISEVSSCIVDAVSGTVATFRALHWFAPRFVERVPLLGCLATKLCAGVRSAALRIPQTISVPNADAKAPGGALRAPILPCPRTSLPRLSVEEERIVLRASLRSSWLSVAYRVCEVAFRVVISATTVWVRQRQGAFFDIDPGVLGRAAFEADICALLLFRVGNMALSSASARKAT